MISPFFKVSPAPRTYMLYCMEILLSRRYNITLADSLSVSCSQMLCLAASWHGYQEYF